MLLETLLDKLRCADINAKRFSYANAIYNQDNAIYIKYIAIIHISKHSVKIIYNNGTDETYDYYDADIDEIIGKIKNKLWTHKAK